MATKRLLVAILLGISLSLPLAWIFDVSNKSALKRGDFPAFYAAAKVVNLGEGAQLYNEELQREIQNYAWPNLEGSYFAFAYPPSFAFFLSPLGYLSPLVAKSLYLGILLVATWCAYLLTLKIAPELEQKRLITFSAFFLFAPLLHGTLSGQNGALSLLFYITIVWLLSNREKPQTVLAGVVLGLWCFKPQFGVLGFLLLSPLFNWHLALGFFFGAGFHFMISALVSGWGWLANWIIAATKFATVDAIVNGFQGVSIPGALEVLGTLLPVSPGISGLNISISIISAAVGALIFLGLAVSMYQMRETVDQKNLLMLLGPTLLICSPHAQYYDLGLLVLPWLLLLSSQDPRSGQKLVVLYIICFVLTLTREFFPLSPFVVFPLGSYIYISKRLNSSR